MEQHTITLTDCLHAVAKDAELNVSATCAHALREEIATIEKGERV